MLTYNFEVRKTLLASHQVTTQLCALQLTTMVNYKQHQAFHWYQCNIIFYTCTFSPFLGSKISRNVRQYCFTFVDSVLDYKDIFLLVETVDATTIATAVCIPVQIQCPGKGNPIPKQLAFSRCIATVLSRLRYHLLPLKHELSQPIFSHQYSDFPQPVSYLRLYPLVDKVGFYLVIQLSSINI